MRRSCSISLMARKTACTSGGRKSRSRPRSRRPSPLPCARKIGVDWFAGVPAPDVRIYEMYPLLFAPAFPAIAPEAIVRTKPPAASGASPG